MMKKKVESVEFIHNINPQKSVNMVMINSFMMGSLFFILTLIITIDPNRFSGLVIYQLVLAIPLLYVSSLSYSKLGYSKQAHGWDILGWHTNTLGNLFVLNAIGLVASYYNFTLAFMYFLLFCLLMLIYTIINIKYNPNLWIEKIYKLVFLLTVMVTGGFFVLLI
jgi:hypothetical protein